MQKKVKYIISLQTSLSLACIFVFFSNCSTPFNIENNSKIDERIILESILKPDRIIECYVNTSINAPAFSPELVESIIIFQNDFFFDSLVYLKNNIYCSSDSQKTPKIDHSYRVEIQLTSGSIYKTNYLYFPDSVLVSTSIFKDTLLSNIGSSINLVIRGQIQLIPDQNLKFIALQQQATIKQNNFFNDTIFNKNYKPIIDVNYNCDIPYMYYPFDNFSSTNLSCFQPSLNSLYYSNPNITTQDSIISLEIEICHLSDDIANYYKILSGSFEGTDFFYSPSEDIPFGIDENEIIGLISTATCTTIETEFK